MEVQHCAEQPTKCQTARKQTVVQPLPNGSHAETSLTLHRESFPGPSSYPIQFFPSQARPSTHWKHPKPMLLIPPVDIFPGSMLTMGKNHYINK